MAITQVIDAITTTPDIADPDNFEDEANTLLVEELPDLQAQLNTWAGQANTLAASINAAVAGGAFAFDYAYGTGSTSGQVSLSGGASQSAATTLLMNETDYNGSNIATALDLLDDSTSAVKGFLVLRKQGDGTKYVIFAVTSMVDSGTYRTISGTVAAASSSNPFSAADLLTTAFARTGDKGDTGATGPAVDIAATTHAATGKSTPADADEIPLADSAASYALKKLSIADLRTAVSSLVGDQAVTVHTGNGWGATNTKIRRYTTTMTNAGTDITYADSAANGASFTINKTGLYAIFAADVDVNAGVLGSIGASVNSNQLTTAIYAITAANRLCWTDSGPGSTWTAQVSAVVRLSAGDVVRPHGNGNSSDTSNQVLFSIRRIGA
jgi:hypothetical protein